MADSPKDVLLDPLLNNNPIALQISRDLFRVSGDNATGHCIDYVLGANPGQCVFQSVYQLNPAPGTREHSHYRTNDHHRVTGDRGRSTAESLCV